MRVKLFVQLICVLAIIATFGLWQYAPPAGGETFVVISILAVFALTAELLRFLLPQAAVGSMSFIPYVTAVVLVPNVSALAVIAGACSIAEVARSKGATKFIFNISQLILTYALAISTYIFVGGVSLLELKGVGIAAVTKSIGLPMIAAFIVVLSLNSLLVSHIIALSTKGRTLQVWKANTVASTGADLLATPVIFIFAWAFANFGPIVASLSWIPILGLRQLNANNLELAQTNRELLELMVKSMEARDAYTSGHSRRVKEYAIKIARLLGLNALEIEKIGTAALLHDVGKIHDKYAPILAKADRLTPEEWATIKEHPVDGANLVATMTRLRELVPAVKHHHEHWDGSGYPAGLREEQIPLASRVIMFADTFDAMTSKRPYRGPLGEEEVRAELLRCRGRQFDPEITDRLLESDFWRTLFPPLDRVAPTPRLMRLSVADGRK